MSASRRRPASTMDPKGEFPVDLATYIFHLFMVVGRRREARIEAALKPLGLSVARHRALTVIWSLESCTMSELAEFSATDRTTLTRTVDQLVEAGLVERITPRADRRQVLLNLTEEGRLTCRRSFQAAFRVNQELLSNLTDEDQRGMARVFERFLGQLVDDPAMLERLTLRDARGLR